MNEQELAVIEAARAWRRAWEWAPTKHDPHVSPVDLRLYEAIVALDGDPA